MPSLVPRLAKAYCFECLFCCAENLKENHPPPPPSLSYPYQPILLHDIQEALMLDHSTLPPICILVADLAAFHLNSFTDLVIYHTTSLHSSRAVSPCGQTPTPFAL